MSNPYPEDLTDLQALCRAIEDGTVSIPVPLDRPMLLAEFRAAMAERGEALFGTARKDQMIEVLHSLLWPSVDQAN